MRCIDRPPDRWWLVKQACQTVPIGEPTRADGRVLGVPALREALQRLFRLREGCRSIDRTEVCRHRPALTPGHIPEAVPYLMHTAELHLRARKHRLNGFRQSFEPIDTGDEAVLDAPGFQF